MHTCRRVHGNHMAWFRGSITANIFNNSNSHIGPERIMRTLNEELDWIGKWRSPNEFMVTLEVLKAQDDNEYIHTALKYPTPFACD